MRIAGTTPASLLDAVVILQRQPGVEVAIWWSVSVPDEAAHRRPADSLGMMLNATKNHGFLSIFLDDILLRTVPSNDRPCTEADPSH